MGAWAWDWATDINPRLAGAALPIQLVTVERTVPQAVNLSKGVLPQCDARARIGIACRTIAPQFSIKYAQLGCFREVKFLLDAQSPRTAALHNPVAWGVTNVPAQSVIYALAIADTYRHFGKSVGSTGGAAEFIRLRLLPGIWWTFLREGFATGGGLTIGPPLQRRFDEWSGGALPGWATKFSAGLLAGWACAFATMLPHNCALTAARMAQQGERPTTASCLRALLAEQGAARAATLNFQQRCAVIAVVVACLNTAQVLTRPELSLARAAGW